MSTPQLVLKQPPILVPSPFLSLPPFPPLALPLAPPPWVELSATMNKTVACPQRKPG